MNESEEKEILNAVQIVTNHIINLTPEEIDKDIIVEQMIKVLNIIYKKDIDKKDLEQFLSK